MMTLHPIMQLMYGLIIIRHALLSVALEKRSFNVLKDRLSDRLLVVKINPDARLEKSPAKRRVPKNAPGTPARQAVTALRRRRGPFHDAQYCNAFAGADGLAPRSLRFRGSENQCATAHPNGAVNAVMANVQIPGRVPCQRKNASTPRMTRNSCVK